MSVSGIDTAWSTGILRQLFRQLHRYSCGLHWQRQREVPMITLLLLRTYRHGQRVGVGVLNGLFNSSHRSEQWSSCCFVISSSVHHFVQASGAECHSVCERFAEFDSGTVLQKHSAGAFCVFRLSVFYFFSDVWLLFFRFVSAWKNCFGTSQPLPWSFSFVKVVFIPTLMVEVALHVCWHFISLMTGILYVLSSLQDQPIIYNFLLSRLQCVAAHTTLLEDCGSGTSPLLCSDSLRLVLQLETCLVTTKCILDIRTLSLLP